jgi:hypothetical protein
MDEPLSNRERGSIRRRLAYLQKLKELQLRDLGGFVFELHRFGQTRDELVLAKLAALRETDEELRRLAGALGEQATAEVRTPGIGGQCPQCGELHASTARFCASCGFDLRQSAALAALQP